MSKARLPSRTGLSPRQQALLCQGAERPNEIACSSMYGVENHPPFT